MTPAQYEYNQTIPGWFGKGDILSLAYLANKIKNGTIIELGSMHGRSAYTLSVSSPTSKIFCFDYWSGHPCITADEIERPNTLELFKENTKDCPNVTPIKLDYAVKTIPSWEEPVDMVFLDAAHYNPDDWLCIEFWLPKIKSGGILCGHDYYCEKNSLVNHYPDVVENVARLEEMLGTKMTLHPNGSVWSIKIP
jgi:predicted O-methyltransferase YrrM